MTIWFTADTHFGDHRTINIHKRAFASVAEMDAALVEGWNRRVTAEDEIWHLGDFARNVAVAAAMLPRLNGTKHLIRGNNDPEDLLALPAWASVRDYAEIALDGRKLILCHYPFRSWNGQHKGAIDLHGHSHGKLKPLPRQFDVGVDPRGFQPVSLAELLAPSPAAASEPKKGLRAEA
jgi:calcineurin-like phosphoesterase family protein